jgi:hypothetical protein
MGDAAVPFSLSVLDDVGLRYAMRAIATEEGHGLVHGGKNGERRALEDARGQRGDIFGAPCILRLSRTALARRLHLELAPTLRRRRRPPPPPLIQCNRLRGCQRKGRLARRKSLPLRLR